MAALCVGALVAALPAATVAAAEAGDEEGSCPVLAAAWGMQLTVSQSDNLLLSSPTGPGVPVAQACVDYGVRDSLAFASSPYPGETVRTLPGVLGGRIGQQPPDYPAYAGSRYPSQQQSKVDQPGVSLLARSSETASTGRAQSALDPDSGSGSTLTTAETSVDPAARTSTADAKAVVQPLTVNGVLELGEMVSIASAKYTTAGKVARSSRLRIGRTTVAGQEVEITPDGIRAAGQTAALPDTGTVEERLAQAGVSVRYLAAEETPNGVFSAGVELIVRNENPDSGAVTTLRYILGRSFAKVAPVDAGRGPDTGMPAVPSPPPAPESGSDPVAPGKAPTQAAAPVPDAPAPEAAPPAPSTAGPEGAQQSVVLAGEPVDLGLSGAYLALVLGALAMFASGTLVRLLGVKTRWTS